MPELEFKPRYWGSNASILGHLVRKHKAKPKSPTILEAHGSPSKRTGGLLFHPGALLSIPDLSLPHHEPREDWLLLPEWALFVPRLPCLLSTLVGQAQVSPGPSQLLAFCFRPGR